MRVVRWSRGLRAGRILDPDRNVDPRVSDNHVRLGLAADRRRGAGGAQEQQAVSAGTRERTVLGSRKIRRSRRDSRRPCRSNSLVTCLGDGKQIEPIRISHLFKG